MKRKHFLALSAATFAIIGAGTLFFHMATWTVMASGFGKAESVPTSYQVPTDSAVMPPETKKENETRADFLIKLSSQNTGEPTETDLTMEEAANAGEQYLKDIFEVDLNGASMYMTYNSGTEKFQRAVWTGEVSDQEMQKTRSVKWTYMIDAVTGELLSIGQSRQLDVNLPLTPDITLEGDYGVYAGLAQEYTEKCGLLNSPVDRVEYNYQGYTGNDPDITVDVIGENGESVSMTFSRYDQTLLGITTDTFQKISESALEDAVREVEDLAARAMGEK